MEKLPSDHFLMGLDYQTLESYLNLTKISDSFLYKELSLGCNVVEFVRIREKLLHSMWEKKIFHQIYKD